MLVTEQRGNSFPFSYKISPAPHKALGTPQPTGPQNDLLLSALRCRDVVTWPGRCTGSLQWNEASARDTLLRHRSSPCPSPWPSGLAWIPCPSAASLPCLLRGNRPSFWGDISGSLLPRGSVISPRSSHVEVSQSGSQGC